MTATDLSKFSAPGRRDPIGRWRRRSALIRALRLILPGLIGVIILGLAGSVVFNALTSQEPLAGSPDEPIRMVNPRFVGRDGKGRAFVLTAVTATRDPKDFQKVYLDRPALILDEEGPDPLHVTGGAGIYHENTRKLEVSGGVRLSGARAVFETATSLFDTRTGELEGSGPIQGAGSLGDISAKSYGVYEKGDRMVFKGGVHTVLNHK